MKQRTAFLLAIALTTFVAVVVLGVGVVTALLADQQVETAAQTDTVSASDRGTTSQVGAPSAGGNAELVSFEGTPAYEVRVGDGLLYLDAQTGDVLYDSRNATSGQLVLRTAPDRLVPEHRLDIDQDGWREHEDRDEDD